jgi:hypothetical protein
MRLLDHMVAVVRCRHPRQPFLFDRLLPFLLLPFRNRLRRFVVLRYVVERFRTIYLFVGPPFFGRCFFGGAMPRCGVLLDGRLGGTVKLSLVRLLFSNWLDFWSELPDGSFIDWFGCVLELRNVDRLRGMDRLCLRFDRLCIYRFRSNGYRRHLLMGRHGIRSFRQSFCVLAFDFADRRLELLQLPAQHVLRRARLHILKLALNGATSPLVDPHSHFGRIVRQAVNGPPNDCYKIRHQYFLMLSGALSDDDL